MRLTLKLGPIVAFGLAAALVACGDDGGTDPGVNDTAIETDTTTTADTAVAPDSTTTTDTAVAPDSTTTTDTAVADTATEDDTSPEQDTTTEDDTSPEQDTTTEDDTSPEQDTTTEVTCDFNGVTGDSFLVSENTDDANYLRFGIKNPDAYLSLQFFGPRYADIPLTGPGTYAFGAAGGAGEDNYETCTKCALVYAGDETYFATSGSVTVTEFDRDGQVVDATVNDLVLIEVTIDGSFLSTPVPDGATWCVDETTISYEPECTVDADCSADPAKPYCYTSSGACGACMTDLHCSAERPVCGGYDTGELSCLEGYGLCTGDDDAEDGDDGPAGATTLTLGEDTGAKICGENGTESDWYTFALTGPSSVTGTLTWSSSNDLDFHLFDGNLTVLDRGATFGSNPEQFAAAAVPAGTYYVVVRSFGGSATEAVDYTLNVSAETVECAVDADCSADPAKPYCDPDQPACMACVNSFHCTDSEAPACVWNADDNTTGCSVVDRCTNDDTREHGDDGPAGATSLTATPVSGMICGEAGEPSVAERDFFKFQLSDDQASAEIKVAWANPDGNATADLDFFVYDDNGIGVAWANSDDNPEALTFAPNAAGEYYVEVYSYDNGLDDNGTGGLDYNITMEVTP